MLRATTRHAGWLVALIAIASGCAGTGTSGDGTGGSGEQVPGEPTAYPCTEAGIRQAVEDGGGPHSFLCDGPETIVLEQTIDIVKDVVLDGERNLTVDGVDAGVAFAVGGGLEYEILEIDVELRNMTVARSTIVGNRAFDKLTLRACTVTESGERAILTLSDLRIEGSTISNNAGGGVDHAGRDLIIRESVISGNGGIGGIAFWGISGWIVDTVIEDNVADYEFSGGGITNFGGNLVVALGVVRGNESEQGGGIYNAGTLSLSASTVQDNSAIEGGGVYNADPHLPDDPTRAINLLFVSHSTLSENSADIGGGLYSAGLWQRLENSTVSGNSAESGAGLAIFGTQEGASSITLANVTVTENDGPAITATGSSVEVRAIGTIVEGVCDDGAEAASWLSRGGNLESPGDACRFHDETDQASVSAQSLALGPLSDNGGPTLTHMLGTGSAAIDAMDQADCRESLGEVALDQRLLGRRSDGRCDTGSIEAESQ